MSKLFKFFKILALEIMKDRFKVIVLLILGGIAGAITRFFKQIISVEISINLLIIILFLVFVTILIMILLVLEKNNNKLKITLAESLKPASEKVNKFHLGDIIISKAQKKLPQPPKLSVYKITKDEIICRNNEGDLINYEPEELLTSIETEQVFQRIENSRRISEQEDQERMKMFNGW